ncbi:unnamed protein product [Closterium sp. Naga37s-1]|nr:unnamed protein product [Closterium sp. Naga37s-1]
MSLSSSVRDPLFHGSPPFACFPSPPPPFEARVSSTGAESAPTATALPKVLPPSSPPPSLHLPAPSPPSGVRVCSTSVESAPTATALPKRGVCSYGDRCRYDHVKPKPSSSAAPAPPPATVPPTQPTFAPSLPSVSPARAAGTARAASSPAADALSSSSWPSLQPQTSASSAPAGSSNAVSNAPARPQYPASASPYSARGSPYPSAPPPTTTTPLQHSPAIFERDASGSSLDGPDWLPRSASDLFDEGLPVMRMSSGGGGEGGANQRGNTAVLAFVEREQGGITGAGGGGMHMGGSVLGIAGVGGAGVAGEAGKSGLEWQGPQQESGPFGEEDLGFECEVEEPQQQGVWAEGGAGFASEEEFEDFVREASDFSAQAAALRIGLIALMDEESPSAASAAASSAAAGAAAGAASAAATSGPETTAAASAPIPPAFAAGKAAAAALAPAAATSAPAASVARVAAAAGGERPVVPTQVLDPLGKPAAGRFSGEYTGYDDPGGYSAYSAYGGYGGYGSGYGASNTANAANAANAANGANGAASANGGDDGSSSSSGYAASSLADSLHPVTERPDRPDRLDKPDTPLCTLPRVEGASGACCARGPSCPFPHGDLCPHCGRYCLHPARPTEREEHMKECLRLQRKVQALKLSSEIECSVCLERVLGKARPADRKFGILSHCDHPFCVACIRNWRAAGQESGESVPLDLDNAVRACPLCRVRSHFVTPSVVWFFSEEEKQTIIEGYKRKLKNTDCRYFNYGNGQCPFGTSCFYKHAYRDGRLEEVKLRHLSSADGSAVISRDIRCIIGPHNLKLYSAKRKSEDNFQFRSMYSGDYSFCMDNTDHMAATVQLSYHIGHKPHTHEVAKDEHMQGDPGQVESIRSGLRGVHNIAGVAVLFEIGRADRHSARLQLPPPFAHFPFSPYPEQCAIERACAANARGLKLPNFRPSLLRRTFRPIAGVAVLVAIQHALSQHAILPLRAPFPLRLAVRSIAGVAVLFAMAHALAATARTDSLSLRFPIFPFPPPLPRFPIPLTPCSALYCGVAVLFAIERALAANARADSLPLRFPIFPFPPRLPRFPCALSQAWRALYCGVAVLFAIERALAATARADSLPLRFPIFPFPPPLPLRSIAGVAVLFAMERALAATARTYSFPVPAPVLMLAGIGALMATGLKEAEMVYDWCYPAISFFDQWMPLFFVPSVASIALAPLPTGLALTKSIALLLSSYLLTLFLSALVARSIGQLLDSWGSFASSLAEGKGRGGKRKRGPAGDGSMSDGEKVERIGDAARMWGKQAAQKGAKALAQAAIGAGEKDVAQLAVKAAKALDKVADSIKTPVRQKLPPLPLSSAKYLYLAAALMLSPALLTPVPTAQMAAPGLLLLSIAVFQSAKTLPANIRSLLVPTVAAGGVMTSLMAMYGSYALNNWQAGIRLYSQGAGAFLVALIGPAVGALGFKVFTEKSLLKRYALDIAATCAVMVPIQFMVTALMGRLLMAPPIVINSLIPSHTTLGLAIEMVPLLSASTGLVVAGVTIAGTTGISTARTLLDQWKVRDAIHRGLAVGIASHSLGTSALVAEEPRSAAGRSGAGTVGVGQVEVGQVGVGHVGVGRLLTGAGMDWCRPGLPACLPALILITTPACSHPHHHPCLFSLLSFMPLIPVSVALSPSHPPSLPPSLPPSPHAVVGAGAVEVGAGAVEVGAGAVVVGAGAVEVVGAGAVEVVGAGAVEVVGAGAVEVVGAGAVVVVAGVVAVLALREEESSAAVAQRPAGKVAAAAVAAAAAAAASAAAADNTSVAADAVVGDGAEGQGEDEKEEDEQGEEDWGERKERVIPVWVEGCSCVAGMLGGVGG